MITLEYRIYEQKNTEVLDKMLREAAFTWNHALALQKRYYSMFGKYAHKYAIQKHFAKRIKRTLLNSQSVKEIIDRLDNSFQRFFKKSSKRPPKFKRAVEFKSIVFKESGYFLNGNILSITKIEKRNTFQKYRFSLSREYPNIKPKQVRIKRKPSGKYFMYLVYDINPTSYGKTHNGASVGADFGLKTFLTLSDGFKIESPRFFEQNINEIKKAQRKVSSKKRGSNNRKKAVLSLARKYETVTNKRKDWFYKTSHKLCKNYDFIALETLNLEGMKRLWGRKVSDYAFADFLRVLKEVANKYDATVHQIDKWYPSSKTCTCGYVNKELSLKDRTWTCPECRKTHDRDILAANSILRKGISEYRSKCKTGIPSYLC